LFGVLEGRVAFGVWCLVFCCFGALVLWCFGVLAFWLLVSARCGFAWGVRRSGCLSVFGGLGWLGLAWVCICYLRKTSLFRTLSSPFSSPRSLIVRATHVSMQSASSKTSLSSNMARSQALCVIVTSPIARLSAGHFAIYRARRHHHFLKAQQPK
jgi:hypothetical protein